MSRLYNAIIGVGMLSWFNACAQHDSLRPSQGQKVPQNESLQDRKDQILPRNNATIYSNQPEDEEVVTNQAALRLQEKDVIFSVEVLAEAEKLEDVGMGISPEIEEGKGQMPPVRQVRVKLSIQNRQSQPVWYLLPAQGEVELQADGNFLAAVPQTAFIGREYQGMLNEDSTQQGRLVECYFRGNYQHSFKAFYVPANSSITLRNYALEVWGELKEIELWGVKSLLVNGKKPLQEWLPFPALSDYGNLKVACPIEGSCVCKEIADPAKICAEAVDFMQAKDFKKYHLVLP